MSSEKIRMEIKTEKQHKNDMKKMRLKFSELKLIQHQSNNKQFQLF